VRSPALLPGVDRAAFATSLAMRLRARGVPVDFTAAGDFVRALGAAPPTSRTDLYWAARVTLVRRQADLATFDAVFAAVFDGTGTGLDPDSRRAPRDTDSAGDTLTSVPDRRHAAESAGGLPWATLPPAVAGAEDSDSPVGFPQRLPSDLVALAEVSFEQLTPAQLAQLGQWLESTLLSWPTRRSRRTRVHPAGTRIAIRPTIARARRTGWEPLELVRDRPLDRPRRIVLLCDVSQSMQAQATAYLHLMRALALRTDAEVFAFATSLTRLTSVLAHHSAEVAIEQATMRVTDRFGGTRIATNLQALLASRHSGTVRGAVVIIGSDGWDSDPPQAVEAAMARLRRRAHRVIWMNPRAGAPGFTPSVATMAAALPYCDQLLPADTFASLAAVLRAVSSRA
jgi:uncharacterized protein with von Willebrand factor type A (vWA) domain